MAQSKNSFLSALASSVTSSGTVPSAALAPEVTSSIEGAGTAVYDSASLLPISGNTAGDTAFVKSTSRLYIHSGVGWYNVAVINNTPTVQSITDDSANVTPFALAQDGTPTTITITAQDSDGDPLTYNYSADSNFGGLATISQAANVFTITPFSQDSATTTSGTVTFTVTDGINTATPPVQTFTLAFGDTLADPTNITYSTLSGMSVNMGIFTFYDPINELLMFADWGSSGINRFDISGSSPSYWGYLTWPAVYNMFQGHYNNGFMVTCRYANYCDVYNLNHSSFSSSASNGSQVTRTSSVQLTQAGGYFMSGRDGANYVLTGGDNPPILRKYPFNNTTGTATNSIIAEHQHNTGSQVMGAYYLPTISANQSKEVYVVSVYGTYGQLSVISTDNSNGGFTLEDETADNTTVEYPYSAGIPQCYYDETTNTFVIGWNSQQQLWTYTIDPSTLAISKEAVLNTGVNTYWINGKDGYVYLGASDSTIRVYAINADHTLTYQSQASRSVTATLIGVDPQGHGYFSGGKFYFCRQDNGSVLEYIQ